MGWDDNIDLAHRAMVIVIPRPGYFPEFVSRNNASTRREEARLASGVLNFPASLVKVRRPREYLFHYFAITELLLDNGRSSSLRSLCAKQLIEVLNKFSIVE